MHKTQRFCFDASEEMMGEIEAGARGLGMEPEEFVILSIRSFVEGRMVGGEPSANGEKRTFKRKEVDLPAVIQIFSRDNQVRFSSGVILDLSLGGIKLSIPRSIEHTIKDNVDGVVIEVMFKLEDTEAPAIFKCKPRRLERGGEDVRIGAEFIDGAFTCQQELYRFIM